MTEPPEPTEPTEPTEPLELSIRGLPEWLIREYLIEMGAAPDPDSETKMNADGWSASWDNHKVAIAGGTLSLTQFDIVFTGDDLEQVFEDFMKKAQRGGG